MFIESKESIDKGNTITHNKNVQNMKDINTKDHANTQQGERSMYF